MNNLDSELKTYLLSYHHNGANWVVELQAANETDAIARRAKLAFAKIDGELMAKVPAALGWAARISTALQNAQKAIKTMLS